MTLTIQRAKRVGGSLMVRIPKEVAEIEGVRQGDMVKTEIQKVRRDWFGAFPGLKPFNKREDRFRSKYE